VIELSEAHFVEVLEALHRDQTGLADALLAVRKLALSRSWIVEGRGSYEWDDDRYQEEFGAFLTEIVEEIDKALHKSSRAHQICCGTYRHLAIHDKGPVQMRLNFGMAAYEDYADFVEHVIKVSSLEV
jgi:hypothetical protein